MTEKQLTQTSWLSLTDYSTKYRVSVSTLRRRIKSNEMAFKFKNGKYFLKDEAPSFYRWHRPSLDAADRRVDPSRETTQLVDELKASYKMIFKEKEEKILFLKRELSDLKTLISVLESENARLKKTQVSHSSSFLPSLNTEIDFE